MSTHRLGNQKIVSGDVLRASHYPPRRTILNTLDNLLSEMGHHTEAGDEVLWDTLRLTIEPERAPTDGLRFHATVDVSRDDLVAGFTAMALAEHERGKARREDT